jgi:hypothetical protein
MLCCCVSQRHCTGLRDIRHHVTLILMECSNLNSRFCAFCVRRLVAPPHFFPPTGYVCWTGFDFKAPASHKIAILPNDGGCHWIAVLLSCSVSLRMHAVVQVSKYSCDWRLCLVSPTCNSYQTVLSYYELVNWEHGWLVGCLFVWCPARMSSRVLFQTLAVVEACFG